MLIYRFEDRRGVGCFGNGGAYDYNDAKVAGASCYSPPGPGSEDSSTALHQFAQNNSLSDWKFGFSSKASLRRWFKCAKGRRAMASKGNRLVIYEVPSSYVLRGDWQVIFKPSEAVFRGTLDLGTVS